MQSSPNFHYAAWVQTVGRAKQTTACEDQIVTEASAAAKVLLPDPDLLEHPVPPVGARKEMIARGGWTPIKTAAKCECASVSTTLRAKSLVTRTVRAPLPPPSPRTMSWPEKLVNLDGCAFFEPLGGRLYPSQNGLMRFSTTRAMRRRHALISGTRPSRPWYQRMPPLPLRSVFARQAFWHSARNFGSVTAAEVTTVVREYIMETQFGFARGKQAAELLQIVVHIQEVARLWKGDYIIMGLDAAKVSDRSIRALRWWR